MSRRVQHGRGWAGRAGNAALTIAAIGGTVCLALVPLAYFFHATLIMFRTGSMGPTIPAGSLALVRQMPASAVHVGDVVTVDRGPAPPVTHRVTSVTPAGGSARSITLRGDANPADDPQPYVVTRVRIVVVSAPGLAYAIRAVSNPIALGGVTVAVSALVTWAFWPADGRATGRTGSPSRRTGGARHRAPVPQ
jgi:signal peptidase I